MRLGDIATSTIIEGKRHGIFDQRIRGPELRGKSRGDLERSGAIGSERNARKGENPNRRPDEGEMTSADGGVG